MVLFLSIKDLLHEWILSFCLIMAVSAIVAPLLILFGLKFGVIETLRSRLVQDPRNLEIRPLINQKFSKNWIEKISSREDVSFIIPTTRQISATVDVSIKDDSNTDKTLSLDMIPTGPGDPLLIQNGAEIPGSKQCVLTQLAAQKLNATIGDILTVTAKRIHNGQYELANLELNISGILYHRANGLAAVYVKLDILEAIEQYKDGIAVPEFDWAGIIPKAFPKYDGLAVLLQKKLNKIDELKLLNNTGFSQSRYLQPEQVLSTLGYNIYPNIIVLLLTTINRPVDQDSVDAISRQLRGKNATLIPWVENLSCEIIGSKGTLIENINLKAFPSDSKNISDLIISPLPEWSLKNNNEKTLRKIILPKNFDRETSIFIKIKNYQSELKFKVEVSEKTAPGMDAIIPAQLAGVLRLFKERHVTFSDETEDFVISKRGYSGFRMYSKNLEDIEKLNMFFENAGIPVHTEAERIQNVKALDLYLTNIFWLIAIVAILGAVTSLTASLYASVERKKKELSILRLIGFSGSKLFLFPMYQGAVIAILGIIFSGIIFKFVSVLLNSSFKEHLRDGENLCYLLTWHLGVALFCTLTLALSAGFISAVKTTSIQPANALRDE